MIDNYNEEKLKIYEALSEFEGNEYVTDRLQQARVGDLIDKEQILTDAYNAGYATGFFQHGGREPAEPEPSTSSGDVEKDEVNAE